MARPTASLLYSAEGAARVDLRNRATLRALRRGDAAAAKRARFRLLDDCARAVVEILGRQAARTSVAPRRSGGAR